MSGGINHTVRGVLLLVLTVAPSCSYHINITIMSTKRTAKTTKAKKRVSTSPYNYIPGKGITIPGESQVIPNDSMSLREMLVKHAHHELIDQAQADERYDFDTEDSINEDKDVSWREHRTELDLMTHISDNVKTKKEIQAELEHLQAAEEPETTPMEEEQVEEQVEPSDSE